MSIKIVGKRISLKKNIHNPSKLWSQPEMTENDDDRELEQRFQSSRSVSYSQLHLNVGKRPRTTTTTTFLHHSNNHKMVGALSPMPSFLGIGGHTGGSRQGHPTIHQCLSEEGRGWPDKRITRHVQDDKTKVTASLPW